MASAILKRADLARRHLAFRLARRLGRARALAEAAEKTWRIAPAETLTVGPALFLPGQFDKLRAVDDWTTLEAERRRVHGGDFERPPVTAMRLRDAMLYKGAIYCGHAEKRILPYRFAPPPSRDFPVRDIREGALAGSYLGLMFFGHWLKDDAPLTLMAKDFGETVSPTPPSLHKTAFPDSHVAAYARLLELPWRADENVRFSRLTVFDDEDFTTHKGRRLETLRAQMAARMGPPANRKKVFVKRGLKETGVRRFVNEDEIAEALRKRGFDVLDPSRASVSEIAKLMHGVDLVVGAEGSHMVHALFFLREGGAFFSITAPGRFCTVNKRWTDLLRLTYAFMVGDSCEEPEGFTADIDDVLRTLDLIEKSAGRSA